MIGLGVVSPTFDTLATVQRWAVLGASAVSVSPLGKVSIVVLVIATGIAQSTKISRRVREVVFGLGMVGVVAFAAHPWPVQLGTGGIALLFAWKYVHETRRTRELSASVRPDREPDNGDGERRSRRVHPTVRCRA
jgi:hypothetical protein